MIDDWTSASSPVPTASRRSSAAAARSSITDAYPAVFGFDGHTGRGPDAGIAWLDFEYMPVEAPPQVVGHTVQRYPVREGNVICENVIRKNRRKDGGEAVLVETPERIVALGRDADGAVMTHEFSLPDAVDADGPAD